MEIILSIPDAVAYRFQTVVPAHQRSGLVARLLEDELVCYGRNLEEDDRLAAACRAANRDEALEGEIDAWQSLDDGMGE
uniref:Uncharacterized protein n=1 Tax=Candidatus Kentrum sp. TUN TaxID=2126343 RepID=A0A451AAV7_9GAMM|nr:MAG: hypothetical protein BECKTUN1418F_GA0071002_10897 [Candidatus Kentron sp. TUN]VFK63178.1 MAG: hypothetical protein BECKTUN1418E_GA0071001_10907 [Candidatus Kentron sp. TUN]